MARIQLRALKLLLVVLVCGCAVQGDEQFDSVLGPGRSQLDCGGAVRHPYPDIAGAAAYPTGPGHVAYYGTYEQSYAGSPEYVWTLYLDGAGTYKFYATFDQGDDVDLIILRSCDVSDVERMLDSVDPGVEQGYVHLEGSKYPVVADAKTGRFAGGWVVVQITKI